MIGNNEVDRSDCGVEEDFQLGPIAEIGLTAAVLYIAYKVFNMVTRMPC